MMKLIGITGCIGSGKSAVTQDLRDRGYFVVCADETARDIVKPGEPGADALRAEYGESFFLPDGSLDRRRLAAHVFGYPERVERLNSLMHPIITQSMIENAQGREGLVFLDAALLIQTQMHKRVDFVWLVTARMETRIRRVMMRDALSRDEVLRRIRSQMSDDEMKQYANEVIENDGTLEELHNKVSALLSQQEYVR
jgi:dephospho-CoA kinase